MSDAAPGAGDPAAAPSAGRLLREARERQGLHIAALAASIKVTPKKLEMLEADRFDALPDATFTRALAQTVCRALKIDSAPILRLLPPQGHRLDHVGGGLNAPFHQRPGAFVQREGSSLTLSPVFWITVLILTAAVAVYFVPSGFFHVPGWRAAGAASAAEPRGVAVELPGMPPDAAASSAVLASAAMAAASSPAGGASDAAPAFTLVPVNPASAASAAGAGALQFRATAATWLEVTDGRGRALVSRLVQSGETVDVDGTAPFRIRIGNAAGTRVSFRGQPLELAAYTRDNVARLDLK